MTLKEAWIGLVEFAIVGPNHPLLPDCKGAFTNAIVYADSKEMFLCHVRCWAGENDLELINSEDIEPFSVRVTSRVLDEDLHEAARSVSEMSPVAFDTFENYETDIE